MEKLVAHIIPVYLQPRSSSKEKTIEVPIDGSQITGAQLKENVKTIRGTPKNHQIVVVVDSNFAVRKIVHDETPLSDSDIASTNVYVLECRSGAVDINVQVRWPKDQWGYETPVSAHQQNVKLQLSMSLDDKISQIKRSVEIKTNIEIMDSVIFINDMEIEDEEKSLSHYHCVSESSVKLIIVKFHGSPPYSGVSSCASCDEDSISQSGASASSIHTQESQQETQYQDATSRNPSASMPSFSKGRSRSMGPFSVNANSQRQPRDRQKSASLSALDRRRKCSVIKLPPIKASHGTGPNTQYSCNVVPLPAIGRTCTDNKQVLPAYPASTSIKPSKSSEFASQKPKQLKEKRPYCSEGEDDVEGSHQQTSTEDEAAVIPVSGRIYKNEKREFTPSFADHDAMSSSTPTNESLKDVQLNLRLVRNELYPARSKWFDLGLELRMDHETLQSIEKERSGDTSACLREMLHYWLQRVKPPPTWKAIIEALKCSPISEGQLAQRLEEEYIT